MKERMNEKLPSQPQTFWHAKKNTCRILKLINRLFTFSVARKNFLHTTSAGVLGI